ncbi:MAG: hypothetical protein HYU64_15595 [Armatimonadetes bacterium]|nr:hypothetical protein [Armatimonadota bacterium]
MALHELDPRDQGDPFFPHHWLKEVMMVYIVLGILLTLCILSPFALHEQADPMSTPAGIKPEWYFLAPYQILKYIPKIVGIIGMGIMNVVLILWPFMDREFRGKRLSTGIFHMALVVGLMGFLLFSALGHLSETTIKVGKAAYHIDLKGIPHRVLPTPGASPGEKTQGKESPESQPSPSPFHKGRGNQGLAGHGDHGEEK